MFEQIPFIGRESELQQIYRYIQEWGTKHVICLQGPGGIGKTRILQELMLQIPNLPTLSDKTVKIAIVSEVKDSEWFAQFHNGLKEIANILNVSLILPGELHTGKSLRHDLENAISRKPNAIIINLGSRETLLPAIKKAIAQDISILTLDNHDEQIEELVSVHVSQDDWEGAKLSLEELAQDANYHGECAAIWAEDQRPLVRRMTAIETIKTRYPLLDWVDTRPLPTTSYDQLENSVYERTREIITEYPNLKAIWAPWDKIARCVVKVLQNRNRTDIRVHSFDLGPNVSNNMTKLDSPWISTVATNPIEAGHVMVRLASAVSLGRKVNKYYSLPMNLVTKDKLPKRSENFDWHNISWGQKTNIGWFPEIRALQAEVSRKITYEKNQKILGILDFDDRSLHSLENLGLKIIQMLGDEKSQQLYLSALSDYRQQANPENSQKILDTLTVAFNQASSNQRLVIMLDTVEKLTDGELWTGISNFIAKTENAVFILAGRPPKKEDTNVKDRLQFRAHLSNLFNEIKIGSLNRTESSQYLNKRQKQSGIIIDKDKNISKTLLSLAQGRPIIIDLVFGYIALGGNLKELDIPLASSKITQSQRQDFEKGLVDKLTDDREWVPRLILIMSWVYPLNINIAKSLLSPMMENSPSSPSIQDLFNATSELVFVKHVPSLLPKDNDLWLSLHDVVRDAINPAIWEERDKSGRHKAYYSRLASEQYTRMLEVLDQKLDHEGLPEIDRVIFQENRKGLVKERTRHEFHTEMDDAFKNWGTAIYRYRWVDRDRRFVKDLINLVQGYDSQFDDNQKFHFCLTNARVESDLGNHEKAKEQIEDLIKDMPRGQGNKRKRAEALNALALVEENLGMFKKAKKHHVESLELFKDLQDFDELPKVSARCGYIHRLLGEYNAALTYYEYSLDILNQHQEKSSRDNINLRASVELQLAYVHGLQGKMFLMKDHSRRAMRLWEKIDTYKNFGKVEIIQAIFARDQNKFPKAVELLDQALRRYDDLDDDYELIIRAYYHKGWTEWFSAERLNDNATDITELQWDVDTLKRSVTSLEKSKELSEKYHYQKRLPGILHQLASAYWSLGQATNDDSYRERARDLNKEALELSKEMHDDHYHIDSILGNAEWDYETGRLNDEAIKQYNKELEPFDKDRYSLYFGRWERILGDIAFNAKLWELAFKHYAIAFTLINKRGGYAWYAIDKELLRLENRLFKHLKEPAIKKWVGFLQEQWESDDMDKESVPIVWCKAKIEEINWDLA